MTEDTEIRPALTAEEWAAALANIFEKDRQLAESCDPDLGNDHKRAALSLHGKPFGFTHAMLDALADAEVALVVAQKHAEYDTDAYELAKALATVQQVSEIIEALLPPR